MHHQNQDHFGKPQAQKISGNEEMRDWDPTDSDPNNPWNGYQENVEESTVEETITEMTSNNAATENADIIESTETNDIINL